MKPEGANKCSKCKADAVITLHYAGTRLCKRHFFEMFEKRFRKTVREFKLITKGERIAIGLSGGKDSTVLLHLLAALRKDLPFELIALTIDEGIANYRAPTLKVAAKEAKRLGVRHVVLKFKAETGTTLDALLKKKGESLACSYCGVIRRRLLNQGARKLKATKLAIGHNLDDMAQTVLMNLMRNEPLRLVRFMEPVSHGPEFVQRIRPLMRAPEREIAAYAMLKGIQVDFRECPYARNAFRQEVRHKLNELEEQYPGTKFRIFNSFVEIQKMMRAGITDVGEPVECKICGEPSSTETCMYCKMLAKPRDLLAGRGRSRGMMEKRH